MSSRRRIPHIVGTSPIAWYGSIICVSSQRTCKVGHAGAPAVKNVSTSTQRARVWSTAHTGAPGPERIAPVPPRPPLLPPAARS
jgi:hypothetical protein